ALVGLAPDTVDKGLLAEQFGGLQFHGILLLCGGVTHLPRPRLIFRTCYAERQRQTSLLPLLNRPGQCRNIRYYRFNYRLWRLRNGFLPYRCSSLGQPRLLYSSRVVDWAFKVALG